MEKLQMRIKQFRDFILRRPNRRYSRRPSQSVIEKKWLDLQISKFNKIKRLQELEHEMQEPPSPIDEELLDRVYGSLIGLAIGDATGAHVEFRPNEYLVSNSVKEMEGGGTWGLKKGQFTDDTSMALCLAISLVVRHGFVLYDQLVRYKWWMTYGYMSSTGQCFDIGKATSESLKRFIVQQQQFAVNYNIPLNQIDYLSDRDLLNMFPVNCSEEGVAGNGALMRLAPVPLFFGKDDPVIAVEYSGLSGQITHGDRKAYDACRYYGALIYAAVNGYSKEKLLDNDFYKKHKAWFRSPSLCEEVMHIAEGSYKKKNGYADGIRGKGYIINALEAALWAFWNDENNFEKGVLEAVNLGDDTDTTAAIYGQLAGAYYGRRKLPDRWVNQIYANKFIFNLSKWLVYEGMLLEKTKVNCSPIESETVLENNMTAMNQSCNETAQDLYYFGLSSSKKMLPMRRASTRISLLEGTDFLKSIDDNNNNNNNSKFYLINNDFVRNAEVLSRSDGSAALNYNPRLMTRESLQMLNGFKNNAYI